MNDVVTSPSPNKTGWIALLFFSLAITFYAIAVGLSLLLEGMTIILPDPLRDSFADRPLAFYLHIFFGAIALITGSINGYRPLIRNYRNLHKNMGRVYVTSIILSSFSGLYMAFYSAIGWIDHLGFALLAIFWFTTTMMGYLKIRGRSVVSHREWMMRSFALTFAAVTLRLWMPILIMLGLALGYTEDPFSFAYPIVSFMAWIPNILVVEWYLYRKRGGSVEIEVASLLTTT